MIKKGKRILAVFSTEFKKKLEKFKKDSKDPSTIQYVEFELDGIENPIAFVKGAWCLKRLGEKMHKCSKLGEIDAFVCYKSRFLFIETKKSPKDLKKKQLAAYIQLVRKTEGTLYIVFGDSCKPESYILIDPENPKGTELRSIDFSTFQTKLENWCDSTRLNLEYEEFVSWTQAEKDASNIINRVLGEFKNKK